MDEQPRQVRIDGARLAYVDAGAGDSVVFVHGSLGDFRSWGFQMEPFAKRYRAIAYSRRGHWPNDPIPAGTPYAIADHMADLGAMIEALGIAPVHLVGASYGAMTALTLTAERPELVRSLVLGEPPILSWLLASPKSAPLVADFDSRAWSPAREAFRRGDQDAGVRRFIDGVVGSGGFDRLPEPARAMMLENAPEMANEVEAPPATYFTPLRPADTTRIRIPTLLLTGEASPPMFGRIIDELAGSLPLNERAVIPHASHAMQLGNPPAYNESVLAFLARH